MFKIYDGRSHFYQWDIDRKLIVEDASISEVHFCNQTDNYSLVCKTYIEDGLNLVNVPNILLQNDWRINVYAYDTNYTKFSERFDVIQRCKPEDYVYTETEILNYNTLSDRIDAVDKNIGETIDNYLAEHLNNIETVVNEALTQAKESGEFDGITPTIGDNGNWYLGDTDTNKPSRGPKGDKGDTGATGADGKSAYSYAQDGGYAGTEEEFAAKLAAESIDKALFVVNITTTDGVTYSADKTFEEIVLAYNEGKYNIVAIMALRTGSHIMPLLATQKTGAVFGMVLGQTRFSFVITSNNEVQREMIRLATLDSKLPNPYPLTFTGAVNETYDGSSAKTIEIPSGGGGDNELTLLADINFDGNTANGFEYTGLDDVSEIYIVGAEIKSGLDNSRSSFSLKINDIEISAGGVLNIQKTSETDTWNNYYIAKFNGAFWEPLKSPTHAGANPVGHMIAPLYPNSVVLDVGKAKKLYLYTANPSYKPVAGWMKIWVR